MKKIFIYLFALMLNLFPIYGQSGWRADLRVFNENH